MLVVILAGAIANTAVTKSQFHDVLSSASSALLGVVSYYLFSREVRSGTRLVFLNFAVFFGSNALIIPIFQLIKNHFAPSNEWVQFYFFQYNLLLYFLLLSVSVVFIVLNHVLGKRALWQKCSLTLLLVGATWMYFFHPFLADPLYLKSVPEFRNFKAVCESIKNLQNSGRANPSIDEIASVADLQPSDGLSPSDEMTKGKKKIYVADVLPYVRGDDQYLLFYKPLWLCCFKMSLLSIFAVLFFIVYKYLMDSPEGAYVEKIVWCFLPYCCFEALHYYAYARVNMWSVIVSVVALGAYLSTAGMWLLVVLFGLRLRFIQSVEGHYYERRLISDARDISRWRDAFDNWVLRQFMNPKELDRRLAIRRNTKSDLQD